jgi:hypothetical protein
VLGWAPHAASTDASMTQISGTMSILRCIGFLLLHTNNVGTNDRQPRNGVMCG